MGGLEGGFPPSSAGTREKDAALRPTAAASRVSKPPVRAGGPQLRGWPHFVPRAVTPSPRAPQVPPVPSKQEPVVLRTRRRRRARRRSARFCRSRPAGEEAPAAPSAAGEAGR